MKLPLLLTALFLCSCSHFDAEKAVQDLSSGSSAKVGEMRAGFYQQSPSGQSPSEILEFGQVVEIIEAHPLYSRVISPWGQPGFVSTFDLIPMGGR